jgi:hypothetical protein
MRNAILIGTMIVLLSHVTVTAYVINYIRLAHPEVWMQLGQPSALSRTTPFSLINFLRSFRTYHLTFYFILLSSRHSRPNDARLSKLVWSARILAVVGLLLVFMLR